MSEQIFPILESSPHLRGGKTTPRIMYTVVALLLPMCIAGVYFFGTAALYRIILATAVALATEYIFLKLRKKDTSAVLDGSAVITGILLALTLPPTLSLFNVGLGSVVAIAIGKQVFGGLGYNIFNPALVGRAFLQAAFPLEMTTWVKPFFFRLDSITAATPLGGLKFSHDLTPLKNVFLGNTGGCIGETSALLILITGVILLLLKMADWRIPVSIFSTVIVFAGILHLANPDKYADPLFYLFSGGLMLGAFFMATDMVSSPVTAKGTIIYGVGIGLVLMIIRIFGGLPEGVMFAILFMNAFVPLLNRYTKPRVFGEVKHE
jgi:electron transport complex protein RnfD